MTRARLILADDHAVVAQGLAAVLRRKFDVVASVPDGARMVESVLALQPDAAVADVAMPILGGLDALRQLRAAGNDTRVVFLTMHADPRLAAEGVRAGASGFVLKHAAADELIRAITEVLQGGVYLSPAVAAATLALLSQPAGAARTRLSRRQLEVLRHVIDGQSMKQIASALGISPRTVETHKYEMMQALRVRTTAELIRYALHNDLVHS